MIGWNSEEEHLDAYLKDRHGRNISNEVIRQRIISQGYTVLSYIRTTGELAEFGIENFFLQAYIISFVTFEGFINIIKGRLYTYLRSLSLEQLITELDGRVDIAYILKSAYDFRVYSLLMQKFAKWNLYEQQLQTLNAMQEQLALELDEKRKSTYRANCEKQQRVVNEILEQYKNLDIQIRQFLIS